MSNAPSAAVSQVEEPSMNARAVANHGPLPPCPHCGSPGYLVWLATQDHGRFKCTNMDCGAEGGRSDTIAGAVAKWSARPSQPTPVSDAGKLVEDSNG